MKNKLLLSIIASIFLLVFSFYLAGATNYCVGATYNFSCGQEVNQSCNMNGSMDASTNCFLVYTNGITINCSNYEITYSDTGTGRAIYVVGANNVVIKNCKLTQTSIRTSGHPIQLDGANSTTIFNISAYYIGGSTYGVFSTNSHYNNFSKMNLTYISAPETGLYIQDSSYNNFSKIITLSDQGPTFTDAVRLRQVFGSGSNNNRFYDCNFSDDIVSSDSTDNDMINVTSTSASVSSTGKLNFLWYVDVFANDTNGAPINSGNITFFNVYNQLINYSNTRVDGYTPRLNIRYYMQNATNIYYDSNYSVNSTNGTYFNYKTFNLTGNMLNGTNPLIITFNKIAPSISYSSPTPANGTTQTTSRDVVVNVTATDDGTPYRAWMTLNASTYNNQTWINNTNISFTAHNLQSGNYTYNVTVCDLDGNCNITPTYQINISSGDIGVYISYPTEGLDISSTSFPILVNMTYSVTYGGVVNCTYNVTGTTTPVSTTGLDCSQGYQPFYVSLPGSYVISIYSNNTADGKFTLSNRSFTATLVSTPGAPPGGGGSPPTCNNVSQKWKIETDRGGTSQYLLMLKGDERTTTLLIYNLGTTTITMNMSCVAQENSNICDYVSFDKNSITILPNSLNPTDVGVTVNLKDYPNTNFTKFIFTINANDGEGCEGKVDYVIQQSALGAFFTLDNVANAVQSTFTISLFDKDYQIPHWLIMILILSLSLTIGIILQNQKRNQGKLSALWAFVIGIVLDIIYIIILMVI